MVPSGLWNIHCCSCWCISRGNSGISIAILECGGLLESYSNSTLPWDFRSFLTIQNFLFSVFFSGTIRTVDRNNPANCIGMSPITHSGANIYTYMYTHTHTHIYIYMYSLSTHQRLWLFGTPSIGRCWILRTHGWIALRIASGSPWHLQATGAMGPHHRRRWCGWDGEWELCDTLKDCLVRKTFQKMTLAQEIQLIVGEILERERELVK